MSSETLESSIVDVVVLGLVNAGKSSLINALCGQPVRDVGPISGTTSEVVAEPWTTSLTQAGPFRVRLIDTPGLEDIDHPERGEAAREAARHAELIVFLTEGDLTASEMSSLLSLHAWGKPILVALNKSDQLEPREVEDILDTIRSRLNAIVPPEDVLSISAAPLLRERSLGSSGIPVLREIHGTPVVANLRDRLADILSSASQLKSLRDASEKVEQHLAGDFQELTTRRAKARQVADETGLGLALALAINPVPLFDLLTAPAGLAILVRRLASVYEVSMGTTEAQSLASELLRGGQLRLWGTLAGAGAGALLKFIPGLGHAAGALAEGAFAGLFVHILSRALIEYFEQGSSWGNAGLNATLDRLAAETDRIEVTRGLVEQLRRRLAEAKLSGKNRAERPSFWNFVGTKGSKPSG